MSNTAARTITVPANSAVPFPTGTIIYVANVNTGAVTVSGDSGVTVNTLGGLDILHGQYSAGLLIKTATDTWLFQNTTRGMA
jgi:hypothetical protein